MFLLKVFLLYNEEWSVMFTVLWCHMVLILVLTSLDIHFLDIRSNLLPFWMLITKGKVPARSPVGLMNFSAGREIKQSHSAARRFRVARTLPISSLGGEAEQVRGRWGEPLYLNLSPMLCLKTLDTGQDLFLMACQCYTHLIQFTVRETKEIGKGGYVYNSIPLIFFTVFSV